MTARVLVIVGSLRRSSYNLALARLAQKAAPPGVELELYERLREIPPYDEDADLPNGGAPEPIEDLRRRIEAADAVLLVTPEYNGSIPGVLKNAIDWASRPPRGEAALWGKTVAVAGASTGQHGALWAQQELRRVLGIAGARVVDGELPVARAHELVDVGGRLHDPGVAARLRAHLEALVGEAVAVRVAA